VGVRDGITLAIGVKPLSRKFAHGFEHGKPSFRRRSIHLVDEALVKER